MKGSGVHFVVAVTVMVLIGFLDYVTGEQLELYVLYPLPIAYAAWHCGLKLSILLSFVGAGAWFFVNHIGNRRYSSPFYADWAGVVVLLTFLAASLAVYRIHALLDEQNRLNRELTAAMARIKKLTGRLPICLGCKRIENEAGAWVPLEEYLIVHSEDDFVFQQRVCPSCKQDAGTMATLDGEQQT